MKHNKIALKMGGYYAAVLVGFALIMATVFLMLYTPSVTAYYHQDMQATAERISRNLSGQQNSYHESFSLDTYILNMEKIVKSDIWLVDKNRQLITPKNSSSITYKELPENAEQLIEEVLKGVSAISQNFSGVLDKKSLTMGIPFYDNDGNVNGVVLLHRPIKELNDATSATVRTFLISILIATSLTAILILFLSIHVASPLNKMKNTAVKLAQGDYTAKTNLNQNDELGYLARSIDVLADKLYASTLESARLDQQRANFFSDVSHELRTPVTIIRGSLEALCDGVIATPEKIGAYHRQMLKESLHLQRLINDLLELSRLSNVDFVMEVSQLNLFDVCNDCMSSGKAFAEKRDIQLLFSYDCCSIPFMGDYGRLHQMLLNHIDNAINFSECGSVVKFSLYAGPPVKIVIEDHGTGISAEDMPYIFDRFHRKQALGNQNGTGLGLTIAKQIAQQHNIKLTVESTLHVGSTFYFEFL